MNEDSATRPGDQRMALGMSTVAFTACFAVWTIFPIIGVQIKRDLGLNDSQFGLLVGTPILVGSLIRLALGIWTDQYGGRLVFTTCPAMLTVPPSASGCSKPAIIRRVVVLPQPEGPSSVTSSPGGTVKDTASTTVTLP